MLQFQISTGSVSVIDDTDGSTTAILGSAYAGQPPYVNDPTAINLKALGPLPIGLYDIGAPIDLPDSVGSFALPLTPSASNQMYDRGGFYWHGANAKKDVDGAQLSSDGCMVSPLPERQMGATFQQIQVVA